MAHIYNDADSANNAETIEHDIVLINIDGKMMEVTEDDPEVRKE